MDLSTGPKLIPAEASAAIMLLDDGRFLMQRRDDKPEIFFPGWLGCFGGALDGDEDPSKGLLRELEEELAFAPSDITHFCTLGLDFSFAGHGIIPRHFFLVNITDEDLPKMRLAEGKAMELIGAQQIWEGGQIIPYDATALWQLLSRHRF